MKVRNRDLETYIKAFQKLAKIEFTDIRGFKIYKFITNMASEFNSFMEYRISVEKEYFKFDDNGNLIMSDDSTTPVLNDGKDIRKYLEVIDKVMSEESDVEVPDIILTEDEIASAGIPLSASDWAIYGMFMSNNKKGE